jgi:hypothetical protein
MITQINSNVIAPTLIIDQPSFAGSTKIDGQSYSPPAALPFSASMTLDLASANNFAITLTGSLTLNNPINPTPGQSGIIRLTQDAVGGRSVAFGTNWKFTGGVISTADTTPLAVNLAVYYVESQSRITVQILSTAQPVVFAPQIIDHAVAGMYSLVVPAGATSATITTIGGGGGSGATAFADNGPYIGAPGGAGGKSVSTVAVTPGQTLTIYVGSGGGGGVWGGSGAAGTGYAAGGAGAANGSTAGAGGGGSSAVIGTGVSVIGPGGGGGAGGCTAGLASGGYGGAGGSGGGAGGTTYFSGYWWYPTAGGVGAGGADATYGLGAASVNVSSSSGSAGGSGFVRVVLQ